MKKITLSLVISTLLLAGCDQPTSKPPEQKKVSQEKTPFIRDESFADVSQGSVVFKENCQVCHGNGAAGLVKNWKKRDANGNLPAPPLNGTAHAWHHDLKMLLSTVNQGGKSFGGTMPPFKDKLNEAEKLAVLAYIRNLWPDERYQIWRQRNVGQ